MANGVEPDIFLERFGQRRGLECLELQCVRRHVRSGRRTGEIHRWLPGSVEWEIEWPTLADVPDDGIARFGLDWTFGLLFAKQPPLTQEEIDDGYVRPDNVVNSYAIYGAPAVRVLRDDGTERVDYGCGKAFHLFRPQLIDAAGNRQWCDQTIVGNELRIVLDPGWLANAVYPVVLDPTFGYDSIGASSGNAATARVYWQFPASPPSDGTTDSIDIYTSSTTNATLGIYDNAAEPNAARLIQTAGGALPAGTGWKAVTASGLAISSASVYQIAAGWGADVVVYWDVLGQNRQRRNWTYSAGNLPDPLGSSTQAADQRWSIRVSYTESGGGTILPQMLQQGLYAGAI